MERQYGSFTRSFTLPSSVDPEKGSAHYDKGVLKIKLAKQAEADQGKRRQPEDAGRQRAEGRRQSGISEAHVGADAFVRPTGRSPADVNSAGGEKQRLPFHL